MRTIAAKVNNLTQAPGDLNHYPIKSIARLAEKPPYNRWFPPLNEVNKPNLTTAEAAYYLNRRPQTLRCWACHEDGPISAKRTNGRLDWATIAVKRIAGVA